jgi:hypothetical protein
MITDFQMLAGAVVVVGIYAAVANRLMVFGERFRRRAMKFGGRLLSHPDVPQRIKDDIEDDLATLPNWLPAWALALAVTPCAIAFIYGGRKEATSIIDKFLVGLPQDMRLTYSKFNDATLFAWLSNSPSAAMITAVQFIFWSFWISSPALVDRIVEKVSERITGSADKKQTAIPA